MFAMGKDQVTDERQSVPFDEALRRIVKAPPKTKKNESKKKPAKRKKAKR